MSDTPYMKLFVGDLLADTMELDNREFGAYMRILFALRQSKTGQIHMRKMKLVSRCGRDWAAVWACISEKFSVSADGMVSFHTPPAPVRRAIPADLRAEVMHVETCTYCGCTSGPFELDHIIPVSRGGGNDPENLTCACQTCNRSKGAKTVEEWMVSQ